MNDNQFIIIEYIMTNNIIQLKIIKKSITKQMQALRERKQQYLRENILDKNHDPNQFMDYCQSTIGSVDIDQWSFDQLAQIVQDYIQSTKKTGVKSNAENHTMNQFDQWDSYIEECTSKKQEPKFQLNLLDLDFLEGIAGSNTSKSSQPQPQKAANIPKIEPNKNYMTVPADVVKKLQQGNDNFIVAYNPIINVESKPKSQIKIEERYASQSPSFNQEKKAPTQKIAMQNSNFSNLAQNNNENFTKNLVCKKIINKSRLQGNEQAIISGHQIINPNVFVPKYVLYFVTINPLNIQVKRRLKDFQSLRELLVKFFPTTQIPHLQRCSRLSQTQPATIKKQILFLQSFLNNLIMKKDLRCKLLQQFLLCKDLDLLKKIFKEYQKLSGPRSLQGLFSPSGEIQLKMSIQNRKFVNQNFILAQFMKQHFGKMKSLYDVLIEGFEQNAKTISQIEQLHKIFKQKIKNVNIQFTPQYQCPQLQKSLQRVELMHKQWASSFKTQVRIIQNQLRHLYRYEQDNINTMTQLLKFQQQITSAYAKRSDKDQANRQPYDSRKLQQFKLTLQSPSKNITVLKHQAAYMQQKVSQQCLGYLQQLSKKIDYKFKLFCTLQYSICQDMQNAWKHFQTYYK